VNLGARCGRRRGAGGVRKRGRGEGIQNVLAVEMKSISSAGLTNVAVGPETVLFRATRSCKATLSLHLLLLRQYACVCISIPVLKSKCSIMRHNN
jgi:hypothetical protein